jgi:peptidoglycan/LPS O-acetylase OafA/YrhL
LDGIRGVAIGLVLVWHFVVFHVETIPGSLPAYGIFALSFTWAGVDVFFVLSGFLIGRILFASRTAPHYFTSFYVRRVCRIAPLYYLTVAAFFIVTKLDSPLRDALAMEPWSPWFLVDTLPFWVYATFLQNWVMADVGSLGANWMGMSWSLAVEVQFYLMVPFLVRFVQPATLTRILWFLVLTAPLLRMAFYWFHHFGGLAAHVLLPARWDDLFFGMIGAAALQKPETVRRAIPWLRVTVIMSALLILGLLAAKQSLGTPGLILVGYTAIAVLSISILLLAMVSEGGRTQKLLRRPSLVWLGTISYAVYLIHQPVSAALHGTLRDQQPRIREPVDALVTLLALVCTLLLAALLTRWIDLPIRRAGRRLVG